MTVRIEYTPDAQVSTQQMLNLAYRIFNETTGALTVTLVRKAQNKNVVITLLRMHSGGIISESITSEDATPLTTSSV